MRRAARGAERPGQRADIDYACMRSLSSRIVLAVVLAGVGALLFYRAAALDGGPLLYFLSAVFIGMALAALQSGRRPPGG